MAENAKKADAKGKKKLSFWGGVKREWNKIVWLNRDDAIKETGLVIVMSLLMGIIITVVDSGALQVIDWILEH